MDKTLLIVEDRPTTGSALREYFESLGFEVDCATDRDSAISLIAGRAYSAVITDLCLAGKENRDGLQVIRAARTRRSGAVILLLTAYGSLDVTREAIIHGADVVVAKPVPLRELARILLERLGGGGA
jgi:DNA-binding response OmpR family regulator